MAKFGQIPSNTDMNSSAENSAAMSAQAASMAAAMASLPRVFKDGVQVVSVKEYWSSAVVSGGVARFYLTDDHTASGNAIFPNHVYKESLNVWVESNGNQYQFGSFTVSADRKYIDITITRLSSTSANALINLIGGVVSALTGLTFVSAANGTAVQLQIKGD